MSAPVVLAPEDELMKPGEVCAAFHVGATTVVRWANTGKLTCIRTLGGHRRFNRAEVEALLAAAGGPAKAMALLDGAA